jgi:serine/threonine protein kinase
MGDGRTLDEVIAADGPLPPREAARVGAQILASLVQGHRSGRVHGGVEPSRVVLEQERALLTAFAAEPLKGSPDYLAPERAAGRPPGPEADLWSLGATLYTAVEGRPPAEQPPEPRRAGPLAPVIASLLRPDPAQRPGAEWTGHMLDRVAAGFTAGPATAEALPPRAPTAAPPATGEPPPTVRRPWVPVAAVVLALALIGGLVFLLVGRGTHHQAATSAPSTPPSATAPTTPETPTTPPPTPETPTPGTPSPQPPSTAPPQTPGATVPPGYVETTDPAGFSFAAPTGWTRSDNGMGAGDYSPDSGGHVLRFAVVPNPSKQAPLDGFRQIEQSLTQQGGYTRIDLRANTYQGDPGAYWEFTFGSSHVGAQSFLTPNGTEYTIYLSTPDSDWASYQPVLTTVLNTLTIP